MSWLIPPKPHPLLLFSPFSLLFSFIYITHSNPFLLYFPSLSPSVTTSRSFVTLSLIPLLLSPRSFVTLSPHTLLLSPVPLLPCLLFPCYYPPFLCYSVSSSSVTTLCSHVTLSPLTLSPSSHPLLLPSVPLLLCLLLPCHLILCLPCPPSLSCKECLPVLSTGAFTLSKTRPFKHAEHAFLAPWRRPSCPLNMPFLETRVQVFDSKEVTIV